MTDGPISGPARYTDELREPHAAPGGAGPRSSTGPRRRRFPAVGRALAGGGGDHGANLPGAARTRSKRARFQRVRGAHHGADQPQARDRAPLLGGGPVRLRRSAPRAARREGRRLSRRRPASPPRTGRSPPSAPGEVLLRLKGCGLCGSDIAKLGDPATKIPAVFGHEVVGEVAAVGAGVSRLCASAIASWPPTTCRAAPATTAAGAANRCAAAFKRVEPGPGRVRRVRACSRAATCGTRCSASRPRRGRRGVVRRAAGLLRAGRAARRDPPGRYGHGRGPGSIGCLFVQLLKRAGAAVVGCDTLVDRVALARRLGADDGGSADAAGAAARGPERRARGRSRDRHGRRARRSAAVGGGRAPRRRRRALLRRAAATRCRSRSTASTAAS